MDLLSETEIGIPHWLLPIQPCKIKMTCPAINVLRLLPSLKTSTSSAPTAQPSRHTTNNQTPATPASTTSTFQATNKTMLVATNSFRTTKKGTAWQIVTGTLSYVPASSPSSEDCSWCSVGEFSVGCVVRERLSLPWLPGLVTGRENRLIQR